MNTRVRIREESLADRDAIRQILLSAFESDGESRLVDTLREQASPLLSRVAGLDENVVGQILFSPVTISGNNEIDFMGLAPMAVLPELQRQGIGSELVKAGLEACRGMGIAGVVVLGHPEFYRRFGFVSASQFNLCCEYDVPDEVFMAVELKSGGFDQISGTVRYHAAFSEL